jgi:purine-binding chemotaxis protein CheW
MSMQAAAAAAGRCGSAGSESAAAVAARGQYLTFLQGRELLAMSIDAVKEILEYLPPTDVPMMPPCIRGVINLRGTVVPVIDLALRLGRPSVPVTKKTCIVVLEVGEDTERLLVGVVVDAVSAVLEIPAGDLEPPPPMGLSIHSGLVAGMGKVNGKFVVILHMPDVLSVEDIHAKATAAAGR